MTEADIHRRVIWLTRLLGVGGLALMGVTWKLWTPQDVFPRVPLFWWAPPHWLDWTALAVTVVGLLGLLIPTTRPARSIAAAITACGFALLFLSDQHRLQPWAWQFFILATVLALGDDRTVFFGWRWLVISIYAWSAVSKFDFEFANGFQQLSHMFVPQYHAGWPRLDPFAYPAIFDITWYAAFFLPSAEITTAILLAWTRTRRMGLCAALVMHCVLLAWLGPMGLNHKPGVLFWNAFFLVQNLFLFRAHAAESPMLSSINRMSLRSRLASAWLAAVFIWPILQHWGLCDAWLGWAVYAPPLREVQLVLPRDDAMKRLPPRIDAHMIYTWCGLDQTGTLGENRWSLATVDAPSYPDPRFQIGIYLDLYEQLQLPTARVRITTRMSRLNRSGVADERPASRDMLIRYARTFRLNAFPESYYRRLEAERRAVAK
jgi:hypothetical protein